ncbi:MAG: disulfide bond formation protein DsbD [Micavibrio aeruginosavorus]|uniref:Disulfide bond formation protein DsbD n=1 Tax=Micavibrio aeruginosavorus TaxID=349221 RepID=A0A2W5QA20_9BACT|nr:MAG: disulfide bond formation protein DsbD [Micavibrio aeruginosavorus]
MKADMFQKRFLFLALVLSFFSIISYTSQANAASNYVSIRLLPEKTALKGGESLTIGIEQTIADGWHTYWVNPGDSGTAPRITWKDEEITASPIEWPIPKKLPMGPLTNFGYEKKVTLLQTITLPENLSDGPQTITADIDVLVCNEICLPESHTVSFTVNDGREPSAAAIEKARAQLPLDMGWPATLAEDKGDLVVAIDTDTPSAFGKLKSIELYPEEWGLILNTETTHATKDVSTLTLRQKRGERALDDVPVSKLVIAYEDASGQRKAVRVSTLDGAAAPGDQTTAFSFTALSKALLLALLGGIVLNLMPCVFPVLSMKALSLVQMKDKELSLARAHGIAYTLGILVCFAAVAGVLIVLKTGGMQVGWGFQLQHPVIILFLAYLFFTLGLNLAGYFEIDFGLSNAGHKLTSRTGLSGSFFTGVLATLVATPCTAPFMGTAMGYALTQDAPVSLLVFLALGFGLALPYLLLSFFPVLRHCLPKPGAWMEKLRQFLAFPMFAAACWLIWVLSQQVSHMSQFAALLGMLAIAFAVWLWKGRPKHIAGHLLYIVVMIASFGFVASTFFTMAPAEPLSSAQQAPQENWEEFSRPKLQEYLDGNDPVFVNMTAAWCITCKVNEKVALSIDSTKKLFADYKVKYLKGDWTNQNPAITSFLEEYGRSGVPIYVYYGPRDQKLGTRPEPVVLPQILTPGLVENAITPKGD